MNRGVTPFSSSVTSLGGHVKKTGSLSNQMRAKCVRKKGGQVLCFILKEDKTYKTSV